MKALLPLVMALLLTGCGPYFSTEYTYIPPPGTEGRKCILNCMTENEKCEHAAKQKMASCKKQQLMEKDTPDGITTKCSNIIKGCQFSYHDCYRECGGTIESYTYQSEWDNYQLVTE